jgi:hypothetical protein
MRDIKETILSVLVFLAGIYAFMLAYQAIITWGKL